MDPNDDTPSADERAGDRAGEGAGEDGRPRTWTVRRTGPSRRIVVALLVIALLVVFGALNFRPVHVNFLLFTTRARVVTVILLAAALGFAIGWFVGRPTRDERRHLRAWRSAPPPGDS